MRRVVITAVLLFLFAFGASAQQETENISLAGLDAQIEILYDEWGIPHVYATTLHDLYFAQGYVQARDRWWQMEWWRHLGNGRLGKLAGQSLLGNDIFIRTLGGHTWVQQELTDPANAEIVSHMQSFADGVNAWIGDREPSELAMQYTALDVAGMNIAVEAWTPADTLIWAKVMAFALSGNMDIEMLMAEITQHMPQDMIDDFAPPFPYGQKPTIVQEEDLPITEADTSIETTHASFTQNVQQPITLAGSVPADFDFGIGRGSNIGSNNWVVSGDLTASGKPMLANDPHLSIQMPSIWYEIALHCQPVSDDCPINVAGFTFAPSPGVVIGHNDRIAWGLTNTIADVQDLYQMRVNPDNPLQYEWNGEWRDMTVRDETFDFGDGSDPVTIQVRDTHLGPIINDNALENETVRGFNNDNPLALRWTALQPGTLMRSVLKLNKAQNWDEFRDALRDWDVPSQNAVYADVDGNIGYQMPGNIPIRAAGHNGLMPMPGWTDEYEWRGYIPYDLLPRIENPERGFIATANQAIVPLDYYEQLAETLDANATYLISYFFAYGYRGQRLNDLIPQLAPHTAKTFAQIQGDNRNLSAQEILPYLIELEFDDNEMAAARSWLLDWDMQMFMDSPHAALYANFWARLMDNLYNDQLAPVLRAGGSDNFLWSANLLLQEPDNIWWDDSRTADVVETRDEILVKSFTEGYAATVEALGEDREAWRWGDLHTATFISDPIGRSGVALVESVVNRGPVATSGGSEIVNATGWNLSNGSFEVVSVPSMRLIVDLAELGSSRAINSTGQSGSPFSPHYEDMIDAWRNIDYHTLHWTHEQVEAAAVSRIILTPAM